MKHTRKAETKTRLLVVTPYFVAHGGGIESVAWQLVRHLSPQLRITWMASDVDVPPVSVPNVRFLSAKSWNGLEERTGVPVPIWSLGACLRLWQAVRRSDVVHFHDIAYACSVLTTLFCLLQRKPYIVTQHTGFVDYPSRLMKALRDWVNRVPGCWMLKHAQEVIFISDEVRQDFAPLLPQQSLHFIPNGVDVSVFHNESDETHTTKRSALCTDFGWDEKTPIVLFVGRFVERKGIHLVIELCHQFPQYNWIFAGAGVLDPQNELGPNGRVEHGRRGEKLAELYRAADLMILPSYGEGFPLVVQEALACGTPVLVENALGNAAPYAREWMNLEKLEHTPDDTSRWGNRLKQIVEEQVTNPQSEVHKRRERAKWAQAEWNWGRCAQLHLQLINRIASRKTG